MDSLTTSLCRSAASLPTRLKHCSAGKASYRPPAPTSGCDRLRVSRRSCQVADIGDLSRTTYSRNVHKSGMIRIGAFQVAIHRNPELLEIDNHGCQRRKTETCTAKCRVCGSPRTLLPEIETAPIGKGNLQVTFLKPIAANSITVPVSSSQLSAFTNPNPGRSNETPTRRLARAKTSCVRVVRVRPETHTHAPYLIRACVCLSVGKKKVSSLSCHHAVAGT